MLTWTGNIKKSSTDYKMISSTDLHHGIPHKIIFKSFQLKLKDRGKVDEQHTFLSILNSHVKFQDIVSWPTWEIRKLFIWLLLSPCSKTKQHMYDSIIKLPNLFNYNLHQKSLIPSQNRQSCCIFYGKSILGHCRVSLIIISLLLPILICKKQVV